MAQIQQEGTTFDLKEYTTKLREVLNEILSLHRKTLEQYVEAGKLLIEIKQHLPHGKWLPWLKQERISPSKAELYMKVARNPELYKAADFNLANVRSNSQGLRFSDDGHKTVEEVIAVIEKLEEAMHWLSDEDKDNWQFTIKLDELHAKLHEFAGLCPKCINVPAMDDECPNCHITTDELIQEAMQEEQKRIEVEEQWEQLIFHPAYPWMKVLIVRNGNNGGEIRDNIWSKKNYSKTHDEIAQELGYERNGIPTIGHSPSYSMMADERFRHDLREAYWLESQLQAGAKELGIKLKPVDIKSRLPPRNKLLPRIKLVKFRPVCFKCKWYKHCILEPKGGCSYFIRKGQRNANQLPLLKQ